MPTLTQVTTTIVLNSPQYRERILDGETFWIVPGVILRADTVMNGALVPVEEMELDFIWNGRPVTLYHPDGWEGANVPAPNVPVVGNFFNAEWDAENQRVKGEFWLKVDKLRKSDVGRDVMLNIEKGNPLNVSTGYYAEFELQEGEVKGKHYSVIHRNLRPDHIAILLAETGACSLSDGCGLGVNHRLKLNCTQGKECQSMTVQRFKIKDLVARLPFLANAFAGENQEAEVEFDPSALLSEKDQEKLKAAPAKNTQAQAQAQPQEGENQAAPQLPAEITGMAQALNEIGGVDGFKALLAGMQTVSQFAQRQARVDEQRKATLIANIKQSGQTVFSEDDLKTKTVDELEKLSTLIGIPIGVDFSAMGAAYNQSSGNEWGDVPAPDWMLTGVKNEKEE